MVTKTYFITGKASWAKILGTPPAGYDNGPPEWSFDLILDEKGKADFLASGADKFYIRQNKEGQDFVRFVRKATKQDGTEAKPISVIDHQGTEWNQKTLIGNGSILNVKFANNEVKSKGTKRLKPSVLAVQVWEHSPYKAKSDFPVKADTSDGATPAW